MYKKILVPLDGSHRAEKILAHVRELALAFDAEVILLSVAELEPVIMVEPMNASFDMASYRRQLDEVDQYLSNEATTLSQAGIKVTTQMIEGSIVDGIIKAADEADVDLIAMASHGRTGVARVFYGSVAAGVLHKTSHPLLLIRAMDGE